MTILKYGARVRREYYEWQDQRTREDKYPAPWRRDIAMERTLANRALTLLDAQEALPPELPPNNGYQVLAKRGLIPAWE